MSTTDRTIRLAVAVAVVVVLYLLRAVLVSFLVAMALTCVLNPMADRLTRRLGWSRGMTVSGLAVGLALVLGLLSYFIVPVFSERVSIMSAEAPRYAQAFERMLSPDPVVDNPLRRSISRQVISRVEKSFVDMLDHSAELLIGFASRLHLLVAVPILVFYMVKDAPTIGRRVQALLPTPYQDVAAILFGSCYRALYGYIYGQLALSAIAGGLTVIGLMVLGMPHAMVLGTASGIVEAVPYLGPIAAGTVAAVIAVPQGTSLVLKVVVLYIAIRMLIDLVIGPRILGQALRLHPLTVLLAVLVGGQLLGVVGFFVAPPLAAMAAPMVGWVLRRNYKDDQAPSVAGDSEQTVA